MLARCPRPEVAPQSSARAGGRLPFISVIMPVRNEERFIRATLVQLLAQDYDADRFEILVADGESTDTTSDIVRDVARRHVNVRLLANSCRWSSAGRNTAIHAARGDIILLVDGHCDLSGPGYLRDLADAFERSGADCVGRPQPLDVTNASTLQRAIAAARASRLGHQPDSFIYSSDEQFVPPQSVAVAYRRHVFDRIGLFDEDFDACEDVEFNHRADRAGFRCFFTPRVCARYHPRSTLSGLFFQMMRYGRGRVRLLRKHPDTFTVPCFVPAAFVLGLVIGPMLALVWPWIAVAYAGAVALYGLVVLLGSAAIAWKRRDGRILPWLPLVFFAVHVGAGTGLLRELFVGRRKTRLAPAAQLPEQRRSAA